MNIFRRALHVLLSLSFAAGLGSNLLGQQTPGPAPAPPAARGPAAPRGALREILQIAPDLYRARNGTGISQRANATLIGSAKQDARRLSRSFVTVSCSGR